MTRGMVKKAEKVRALSMSVWAFLSGNVVDAAREPLNQLLELVTSLQKEVEAIPKNDETPTGKKVDY